MKVLTFTGKDAKGEPQDFHIINPMNVMVHTGEVSQPGDLTDPSTGEPIPVVEERTFIRVGGQPIFALESVDEIKERAEQL